MHTISSVLNTFERGEYVFKIDLQDEYFHVLIYPDSKKYLCFAFENKVGYISFEYFPLVWYPSGIYSSGAQIGSFPPLLGDIGNYISQRLVNTPPRPSSFITPPVSVRKHTEHGRPQIK